VIVAAFGVWICMSFQMVFWAMGSVIKQMLDAVQKPWIATTIYSTMIVINLPVAYILIFGIDGILPALGLTGAGLAWLIAEMTTTLILFLYFFLSPRIKKYHGSGLVFDWFFKTPIDGKIKKYFLKSAIPVAIESFFEIISYAMVGVMIGWFGVRELAARQISNGVLEMLYMIPFSMTYTTTIVISEIMGKKNFYRLRTAGFASVLMVSAFTLFSVILLLLFGKSKATFFGKELDFANVIIPLATGFFIIGAISQWIDGLQSVMLGALRGLGDFTFSSIASIVGYAMIGLPLAYIFGFHILHHPFGIIIGFVIGVFLVGIILSIRFWYKTKIT
ncbi:MAG: MATE family efflux transporter, partial [Alphaproteobacteria bacterium]